MLLTCESVTALATRFDARGTLPVWPFRVCGYFVCDDYLIAHTYIISHGVVLVNLMHLLDIIACTTGDSKICEVL